MPEVSGAPDPKNAHPSPLNPFQLYDLLGQVWNMTHPNEPWGTSRLNMPYGNDDQDHSNGEYLPGESGPTKPSFGDEQQPPLQPPKLDNPLTPGVDGYVPPWQRGQLTPSPRSVLGDPYGGAGRDTPQTTAPASLPTHGPHNPVLSEDQAHLLQLLWMVTGQNANTVGRGRVLQFAPVSQGTSAPDFAGELYREDERDASTDQYGDVTDRGRWQINTTGEAQVLHQAHQTAPPSQPAAPRNVRNGLDIGMQSGDGVTPDQKNDKLSRMGQALME